MVCLHRERIIEPAASGQNIRRQHSDQCSSEVLLNPIAQNDLLRPFPG